MPLLNLSLVTQALKNLIEAHVKSSPEWSTADTLLVTPQPPDKLAGEHTIALYLYHVVEDAHFKNLAGPGQGDVPLRYTPMGLLLYYVLTSRSDLLAENGTYEEQRLMGLAMKALHDYPTLDENTLVAGTTVFPANLAGRDNRLRLTLQPVPPAEAVQYWTAGSQPLWLAAYYQVSAALLEPEPVAARAGRVLTYGVHTFVRGTPHLDGSRNRVEFTVPGESSPRAVDLQPAEAPVGGKVVFFGTELSDCDTVLVLNSSAWKQSAVADSVAWGVSATADRVFATIQEYAGDQPILPGIYTAAVKVITERTMPDGRVRRFEKLSNQTPFAVAPRVDSISAFSGTGLATVHGLNFDPGLLPGEAVQVLLGSDRLERVEAGTPAAGQFRVTARDELKFRLPPGLPSGQALLFRILIQGVESAPCWVTVP